MNNNEVNQPESSTENMVESIKENISIDDKIVEEGSTKDSKFYKNKAFIIPVTIVTSIVFIAMITAFIIYLVTPTGEITETYNTYKSELTYTIPKVDATPAKEAVYEKLEKISLFTGDPGIDENNDGKSDYSEKYAGVDFPVGEYKISSLELDEYCSLMLKDRSQNSRYDGTQYYEGDVVDIGVGQRLGAFNCRSHNGGLKLTLTPIGKGELISEATEEIPALAAYDITEKVVYNDYITDICYMDSLVSECSSLKLYKELKDQEPKISSTTSQKLVVVGKKETCYIDGELAECEDLPLIDSLRKNIVVE